MFDWAIRLASVLWELETKFAGLNAGETETVPDIVTKLFGGHYRLKLTVTKEA